MTASRCGTRWRSANISTSSCPTPACCRRIASPARTAARSAARCIRASATCARRCRMNVKAHFPGFKVWAGAAADVERVIAIWRECLAESGGPFLFGRAPCMADAMYAPVCTRFRTYDVKLDAACAAYCDAIMALPAMQDWVAAAEAEEEEVLELDVEF